MDNLGLEDWQKEEVKEDRYSPWNFDDEVPEDYYIDFEIPNSVQ